MNGIILASGFSNRMGANKLLMKINGEEIIRRVIKEIKKSNIRKIILVAREEAIINIGKEEGIIVVKNDDAHLGQSTSIILGVNSSDLDTNFMFFCGDQPFIDSNSINVLIDSSRKMIGKIIVPTVDSKTGSPVIFPSSFKSDLISLEGDIGGKKVIKNNKNIVEYIAINNKLFLEDIDTPEDYCRLSKL